MTEQASSDRQQVRFWKNMYTYLLACAHCFADNPPEDSELTADHSFELADFAQTQVHRFGGFVSPPKTHAREAELFDESGFKEIFLSEEAKKARSRYSLARVSERPSDKLRDKFDELYLRDLERAMNAPEVPE